MGSMINTSRLVRWMPLLACLAISVSSAYASEVVWSTEIEDSPEWVRIAADGSALAGGKSSLSNYDFESGKLRWQRADIGEPFTYDLYDLPGESLALIEIRPSRRSRSKSKTRVFEAIDLRTGSTAWKIDWLLGDVIGFLPIEEKGLALAFEQVDAKKREDRGIFITAFDSETGSKHWSLKFGDYRAKLGSSREKGSRRLLNYAKPNVKGSMLYLPYHGLHAIDLEAGEIRWERNFSVSDLKYRFGYASPVISGNRIYAAGKGSIAALDIESGEEIWTAKLRSSSIVKEILPADEFGVTIARTGGLFSDGSKLDSESPISVVGIDNESGKSLWRYTDGKGSLSELQLDSDSGAMVFADSEAVVSLNIEDGEVQYESPLVYWRLYGLFDEKQSGFSIGGGFSESVGGAAPTGGSGGLGTGSRKLDLGANPIAAERWRDEIIIRGPHYIVSFAPSVRVPQWAAIFSDTKRMDRDLRTTGNMPVFSGKDRAYFLTKLYTGKGSRQRQTLVLLGVSKKTGKIMARHDFSSTDASFLIDHSRDRILLIEEARRSTTLRSIEL